MDFSSVSMLKGILWMPVFNIGFGISPVTLGFILIIFRLVDGFTDPLMGNISDNTHTRWGRRRPYMFIGAFLVTLILPFLWFMSESWSLRGKEIYLTVVGIAYFCAYTVWSMPYYGMQMELTPNYDERSRLTAWTSVFGKLFYMASSWFLPLILALGAIALGRENLDVDSHKIGKLSEILMPLQSWLASFPGVSSTDKPIIAGIRIACWLQAAITLFFGLLPALFVKERYYKKIDKTPESKEPFWNSIKDSLSCKPLWLLIGASFFLSMGNQSIYSLGQYVNFYYVNHGDLTKGAIITGWKSTVAVVVGLSLLPFFVKLGERFDKRRVVIAVLTVATVGHALNYICMTPQYPYLQIVSGVFESCSLGAFWMFLPSMKADVADYDEYNSMRRREGSINAFYSWFTKVSGTLALGLGGIVLQATGFDVKLEHQTPEVLDRMFWTYLSIPLVFWLVSIAFLYAYPLGRTRSLEIRDRLEERRGKF